MTGTSRRQATICASASCGIFVITGLSWIGRLGIQTDEALLAEGIYPPFDRSTAVRLFNHDYPTMIMSYVGALKARIWAPVFAAFGPSALSLRVPAVLLTALSIWLFFKLLSDTLGLRAGMIGGALLATDCCYLLTARYDWGPVVLQHLCLTGAMWALVRFHRVKRVSLLALGFFSLGLGLWDKAVFGWSLAGLAIATAVVFPHHIREQCTLKNIAVAVLALCLGSFPLLRFNIRNNWVTFRSNTVWDWSDVKQKGLLLQHTIYGDALFGFFFREDWETPKDPHLTPLERALVGVNKRIGSPRTTLLFYVLLLSFLLLPWVWRTSARPATIFSAVYLAVTWTQMGGIRNAGGSVHHTILLWLILLVPVAAILGCVSQRGNRLPRVGVFVIMLAVIGSNLLVTSTYLACLVRNGGTTNWTAAVYPAYEALKDTNAPVVITYDWGFADMLRLLSEGKLTPADITLDDSPESRGLALHYISASRAIFIAYVDGSETYPGINLRFRDCVGSIGYKIADRRLYHDRNGREVIQTFHLQAVAIPHGVNHGVTATRPSPPPTRQDFSLETEYAHNFVGT